MRHALRLAARGLGNAWPNPAVGCVIVSPDGRIAGRGWTGKGGRPHAETMALEQAGAAARGATAYVSLEPCAHHGKTPPCADALISSGVARVVGTIRDPDPRVSGQGFEKLRRAGIAVAEGLLADEAHFLNEGFLKRVSAGRPLVAIKVAESSDGFVARDLGDKWITGPRAREHVHLLRAQYDAILAGAGTVLADDPELTCRLPGLKDHSPVRVVLDSHLRTPASSKLVQAAKKFPLWIITTMAKGGEELERAGAELIRMKAGAEERPAPRDVLAKLAERGITRLLVEGGPATHAAFIAAGFADRVHRYLSPSVIGPTGIRAAALPTRNLICFERRALPPDVLENFVVRGAAC
ncbi:MAG: bifunctional diaminohydroxyphosphoribosylaminopyrimidine deaminase/5-amino-6-(5-phosphoribosylamino)uracil reductase RibD [Alphaproteobacteria bacterium]